MNALRRMGAALMGVTTLLVATSVTVLVDINWIRMNTLAMVQGFLSIAVCFVQSVISFCHLKHE